jgi:hypothetical protein
MMFPVETAFATSPYQEQSQGMDIAPNCNLQGLREPAGGRMSAKCS